MKYRVIAEFVDRRNGSRIQPGDVCPDLDDATIKRLVRARCLVIEAGKSKSEPKIKHAGVTASKGKKPAEKEAGQGPALFPGTEEVAGGDGSNSGERSEPGGDGRGEGEGSSADHRDQ